LIDVRHDTDLPEPALVGVTYAVWRADIETNGDLGRLYRVEFNKVLCVSGRPFADRGGLILAGFKRPPMIDPIWI
jgi:hypothetical protein